MNLNTTLAVMRKEFKHITRDRMTFVLTLLSPLLILAVFGYSFLVEVKDVSTAVVDLDQSELSRRYLAALAEGKVLEYGVSPADPAAAEKCVTANALLVRWSESSSLPALKPNQPTHSIAAPSTV